MSTFYSDSDDWREAKGISSGGPYRLWRTPVPDLPWYGVLDKKGTNVLTRGTGAVFSSQDIATRTMRRWNERT